MLEVMKGSLTIMKGIRKNGMYSLQGSTVVGTTTAIIKPETSIANLWHMILGHVSERGLIELSKKNLLCGNKVSNLEFCENCILEKAKRVKFDTCVHKT